jgi:small subunit ribosomal protein S1
MDLYIFLIYLGRKKIKHPAEFTTVDSMLDVVVLDIDQKNRKISLGHKQLESNPWDLHSDKKN